MGLLIKFVGMAVLMVAAILFGTVKSEKLRIRAKNLQKAVIGLNNLSGRISYGGGEIGKLIEQSLGECEFIRVENNRAKAFETGIKKEDSSILNEFFLHLGEGNKEGERQRVELYAQLLERQAKSAADDAYKNTKVWYTLSICAGLAGVILLI